MACTQPTSEIVVIERVITVTPPPITPIPRPTATQTLEPTMDTEEYLAAGLLILDLKITDSDIVVEELGNATNLSDIRHIGATHSPLAWKLVHDFEALNPPPAFLVSHNYTLKALKLNAQSLDVLATAQTTNDLAYALELIEQATMFMNLGTETLPVIPGNYEA